MWGSYSFLFRKKLEFVSFLLIMDCYTRGGVYGEIVSQPLLLVSMCFFLICPMLRSYSASFGVSFREIVSYVTVDSVSAARGEFFLHCHIVLKPETVLYFDCGGSYTIVYICQNSQNCKLKRVNFTICILYFI